MTNSNYSPVLLEHHADLKHRHRGNSWQSKRVCAICTHASKEDSFISFQNACVRFMMQD